MMQRYDVYLWDKRIDTVFYNAKLKMTTDEVRKDLIEHDGYSLEIEVHEPM